MKALRHGLIAVLYSLYGIYAVVACVACLLPGGLLATSLPNLAARRWMARWTLRSMFLLAAMPYRLQGTDKLPGSPCVVIANHRSYLDGLALIAALPPHFSAVIKHQMAEVPFIGWFLHRIGCRFVERESAILAGRDTHALLLALQDGESLAIFPEGTFSPDAGLLPFRDGAFFLAAKAGVPIVPAIIRGVRKILPEGRFLPAPGVLSVTLLEALTPEGEDRAEAARLRQKAEMAFAGQLESPEAAQHDGEHDYAYYCRALADQELPLSYLDLDLLERNIRSTLERSGNKKLRIDARLLQCPELLQRVMRSNARFRGIRCSTVNEALHLSAWSDLDDLLIAYPTVQAAALERVARAIGEGHRLTLTVDSAHHLGPVAHAATGAGVTIPVCVEMDLTVATLGFRGAARHTAIRSIDALLELVERIDRQSGVELRGVLLQDWHRKPLSEWMTGHPASAGQSSPRSQIEPLRARRHEMVDALKRAGHEELLVNGGGVAGMAFNASHLAVTEITVGRALLGLDPEDPAEIPAAGYAAEVIRHPDHELYVCLVGGHTATHLADPQYLPQPYLPRGAELDELHGSADAQLPIRYAGHLALGDLVFLHPRSSNELWERFAHLTLVQHGTIIGRAETYRI